MRAGIPARPRAWTEAERALVIAHQDRPTAEVAALLGRSVQGVDQMRSVLIAEERIRAKIVRPAGCRDNAARQVLSMWSGDRPGLPMTDPRCRRS